MEIVKLDSKISWAIAVACACINYLTMLPTKLSGLFFVEIIDRYQVGRNLAGYPTFVKALMQCSAGPVVGYLAERFGMNEVMILGSVLAGSGVWACFFAEDIAAVIVCFGIIHGLGVAFNFTLVPLIVKACFKKHITLAYGVTQAGSSFGVFFTSPLIVFIFQRFGTSGGFLITGSILLNSLPIVMVLKILAPNRLYRKSENSMKSKECIEEGHLEFVIPTSDTIFDDKVNDVKDNMSNKTDNYAKDREENVPFEIKNSLENKVLADLVLKKPKQFHSKMVEDKMNVSELDTLGELIICNALVKEAEKNNRYEKEKELTEKGTDISEIETKKSIPKMGAKVIAERNITDLKNNFKKVSISLIDTEVQSTTNKSRENIEHSIDFAYSKSICTSTTEINDKDMTNYRIRDVEDWHPTIENSSFTPACASVNSLSLSRDLISCGMTQKQFITKKDKMFSPNLNAVNAVRLKSVKSFNAEIIQKDVLAADIKPKLRSTEVRSKTSKRSIMIFLDYTFWIVLISNGLYASVFIMFWATMIDFSRDKNIDRSMEVYLLMTLPLAEIIGRLGLGMIPDGNYLSTLNFNILCFIGMAFSCSLMALAQGVFVVMTSIFIFGVLSSGLLISLPFLIFQFFDSEHHTMGQASRNCLYGPLSFLNGPLIGYFRGTLGSYVWFYHTLAIVTMFCAGLIALIPVLARMRDEKKVKNES